MSVTGIGGIFFKASNPEAISDWYERHLGLADDGDGVVFGWRMLDRPGCVGQTIWSPFSEDTTYFAPSEASWMINFRVDDLDQTLSRLSDEGVESVGDIEEYDYGRFGWVLDPEGNKVELWEAPEEAPFGSSVPSEDADSLEGVWACPPGTTVAASGDLSERQITKERTVELPAGEVWRLWTTGDGMAEWWAESNRIELGIGGPMELYFLPDQPAGVRGSDNCRILSFVPERMLSFTWNAPPQFDHTRPRHTHVVLEFDELDEGRTRVRLHHLGWPKEDWQAHPQWAETIAYFETAWERVLTLLAEHAHQG